MGEKNDDTKSFGLIGPLSMQCNQGSNAKMGKGWIQKIVVYFLKNLKKNVFS